MDELGPIITYLALRFRGCMVACESWWKRSLLWTWDTMTNVQASNNGKRCTYFFGLGPKNFLPWCFSLSPPFGLKKVSPGPECPPDVNTLLFTIGTLPCQINKKKRRGVRIDFILKVERKSLVTKSLSKKGYIYIIVFFLYTFNFYKKIWQAKKGFPKTTLPKRLTKNVLFFFLRFFGKN